MCKINNKIKFENVYNDDYLRLRDIVNKPTYEIIIKYNKVTDAIIGDMLNSCGTSLNNKEGIRLSIKEIKEQCYIIGCRIEIKKYDNYKTIIQLWINSWIEREVEIKINDSFNLEIKDSSVKEIEF